MPMSKPPATSFCNCMTDDPVSVTSTAIPSFSNNCFAWATYKGQVIKLKKDESILISFVLQGSDPQIAAHAEYNPDDGTFTVKGPTGQGIPPGKYKIGLSNDFYGGGDGTSRFGEEMDSEKTPLVADVGSEEGQFFEVDAGTEADALVEATRVIDALPSDIQARVRYLSAYTVDTISLRLRNGRVVRWGSAEDTDTKARVLTVLLEQPASLYDVSVPGQPVIRR